MSYLRKISLEEKIEFFDRLLLPSFSPLNNLGTAAERDAWIASRAIEINFDPISAAELRVMYAIFSSMDGMEGALAQKAVLEAKEEKERQRADEREIREKAEEMERKKRERQEREI